MERQTSENKNLPVSILESMLMRLTTNESPKTHNAQLHGDLDVTGQNLSHLSPELDRETTCKEKNGMDNTVSSGAESQTKILKHTFPDVFPKWERRRLPPISLSIQPWKKDDKELGVEEPTDASAALSLNSQTESPSRQTCGSPSHLPESPEKDDVLQTELKDEVLDDACDYPPKPLMSSGAVKKLTHQTHATVTSRTARSASDPVVQKSKEQRPLSAPSIFYVRDEEIATEVRNPDNAGKASPPKRRKDSGKEENLGVMEHEMSKVQNKRMKNKMKTLTQKMMEMLKEKHNRERNGSKRSQDSVEEEAQYMSSMEMEAGAPLSPPPLPPKKARYVRLGRTFTLKDFRLHLEPINLMEEIFTGEEWSSYLGPSKTSLPQKDTDDQAITDDVIRPDEDIQLHIPQQTAEHNQSEDTHDNQSDKKQDIIDDTGETISKLEIINDTGETMSEQDNATKVNRHLHAEVESTAKIFAIPKAQLTNAAKQQRVCDMYSQSGKSEGVYDCMGMFMIPKHDFLFMERMQVENSLGFSKVKSFGLLDNSALKNRIHLGKKRPHRPPKKHRKEKTHRINSTFYKIPSALLNESTILKSSLECIPISMSSPLH